MQQVIQRLTMLWILERFRFLWTCYTACCICSSTYSQKIELSELVYRVVFRRIVSVRHACVQRVRLGATVTTVNASVIVEEIQRPVIL